MFTTDSFLGSGLPKAEVFGQSWRFLLFGLLRIYYELYKKCTHIFACDTGLFPGLCCTDFIFCLVLIAIFVPFPVVHFPKESNIVVWVPKLFQWTWILFKPVTFWGEIRTITRQIHSCIFCTLFAITVTLSFFFPPFIFDICEFVLKV